MLGWKTFMVYYKLLVGLDVAHMCLQDTGQQQDGHMTNHNI